MADVFQINKTKQMTLKWETDSQVHYMEPTYKFPLNIGASGEMSLYIQDSRKLLDKITCKEHFLEQTEQTQMLHTFLMAKIKLCLAQTMQNSTFGIFDVDSHMDELSEILHMQLTPDFMDYGILLEHFFVTSIIKPDGDKTYEKFRNIHIQQ
ncbi:MAG: SPFH domain-containing protein [Treponema sp.]|nr:SPFH domain-containing protein [Treponema sp.]